MPSETYPCYVRIGETPDTEELIELPTEEDGSMLLTTLAAQFPDAIGLKFKTDSGGWRGVRVTDGILDAPLEGWGYNEYIVTVAKKAEKRKLDDSDGPTNKTKKELLSDLIVLGLPYSSTEEDLKDYFEKFGELAHFEVKTDAQTKKSRGFGFIRFKEEETVKEVLAASHSLGGRNLEVKFPGRQGQGQDNIPTKLFIGRLPSGTTVEDLKDCFSEYGPLKDVYIPKNFRGFGFVTFGSQAAAQLVLSSSHQVNGSYVNVSHPAPKAGEQNMQMQQYGGMQGGMQGGMPGGMQGGMMGGGMQGGMMGGGMQGGGMMGGGMQGGGMMGGGMQRGMQGSMPMLQSGGYGSQQANKGGYYTSGYSQKGGKWSAT